MLAPSFDPVPGPIGVAVIPADSKSRAAQPGGLARPVHAGDPSFLENCRRMIAAEQRKPMPDLLMVTHLKRQIRRYDALLQQAF